jgi:hypothetical protein
MRPCSLESISQISQSFSSIFLSQQISEQYFEPWLISSHEEFLPQALALDPAGPLVALRVSLY